uniref:Uncharacterized protein n=1 Tax=Nelumbo nucifera TaxID=4432 RepID=A0A822YYB4_NELNU|nr:TPA_asm: hypothetical protein HUJ06_008293 [Nelumbo nucifera]
MASPILPESSKQKIIKESIVHTRQAAACISMDHQKAHALVIPAPVQGHVMPLMELSQSLAIRGVKVTFVTEESLKNHWP